MLNIYPSVRNSVKKFESWRFHSYPWPRVWEQTNKQSLDWSSVFICGVLLGVSSDQIFHQWKYNFRKSKPVQSKHWKGQACVHKWDEEEKGWGGIDKKERDLQGEPGSVIIADHRVFCHLSKTQGIRNITHPESALGLNLYYQWVRMCIWCISHIYFKIRWSEINVNS